MTNPEQKDAAPASLGSHGRRRLPTGIRGWFLRLSIAVVSPIVVFVFVCLAVEAFLFVKDSWAYQGRTTVRNDWKIKVFDKKLGTCFAEDDVLPFSLIPGTYEIEGGRRITINSMGYRGAEFSRHKTPGTLRILFVGDSFTYGYGVDDADTIPRLVQAHLEAAGRDRVEVINAGFHGSCPMQYDLYLRSEGYALEPDVIVMVVFPGNDLADLHFSLVEEYGHDTLPRRISDGLMTYEGRRYHSALPAGLYHFPGLNRSVVWHRLNKKLYAIKRDLRENAITDEEGAESFARYMLAIDGDCHRRGISFRPIIAVGRGEMEGDARSVAALAYIRRFLDSSGIAHTDLADMLSAEGADTICQPHDVHLKEEGNRLAASTIAGALQPVLAHLSNKPPVQTADSMHEP